MDIAGEEGAAAQERQPMRLRKPTRSPEWLVAKLQALRGRVESTRRLYTRNNALVSYFDFIWKMVDIWAPARP